MSTSDNQQEKQALKQQLLHPLRVISTYLKNIFLNLIHLRDDTDTEGTIEGIKSGIVLKGSQLWILVCSTIIACIGLDVNSPAVIIGAMLISPLMSPILGIGLATGLNDRKTLASALNNFAIATALSLIVAFLYFKVTPFGDFTTEMQSRTAPTLLDAFVALFGGLAGIIAGSRTNKSNAIPGVAIATALMPPLCTSGFGLSTGRWEVFGGAFYLFFINAVLISLSTYMIVRLLRFPLVEYLDEQRMKRTKRLTAFFILLLLVPSFYFLYNTLTNAARNQIISEFIKTCIHEDVEKGAQWTYVNENDSTALLKVYYFGQYIPEDSVARLETKLKAEFASTPLLTLDLPRNIDFRLIPTDAPPDEEKEKMNQAIVDLQKRLGDFIVRQEIELKKKDQQITANLSEADSLRMELAIATGDTLDFDNIGAEVKAIFPELTFFSIGKTRGTNFDTTEVVNTIAVIEWDRSVRSTAVRKDLETRLGNFLSRKTGSEEVEIIRK